MGLVKDAVVATAAGYAGTKAMEGVDFEEEQQTKVGMPFTTSPDSPGRLCTNNCVAAPASVRSPPALPQVRRSPCYSMDHHSGHRRQRPEPGLRPGHAPARAGGPRGYGLAVAAVTELIWKTTGEH